MDVDWQVKIISILILFVGSAFFSGSEIALFSLNRKNLKNYLSANHMIGRYLFQLLQFPRRLLVTILIGNTIVNVAASIIAVSLALEFAQHYSISKEIALTLQIILLTLFIVTFGELIPKVWASKNPLAFSKFCAVPLYLMSTFLYPISEIITEVIRISVSKLKFDKTKIAMKPDELSELAKLSRERGTIVEEEQGLIHSIVNFRSVFVQEVMTPRVDIIAVADVSNLPDLLEIINSSGHSRLPLYHNDLDNITGVVYAKDLLPFIKDKEKQKMFSVNGIARKILFVPATKMISDLMRVFQEKKMHIAVVVDEYGGTAGVITLEDILEEIIGEIRDEFDKEESPVIKISELKYMVLGKFPISELNELLNVNLMTENSDFETVGGMVLNQAGHIPKEGYSFSLENHNFTVKEISNKRIKKVLIERINTE
ncbi:MAG: hemolysin family protein [Ignavibacteriaceae bacterium]